MFYIYICTCGKQFDNSQAYNGHRCHCKQYQIETYGEEHYQKNKELILTRCANASKTLRNNLLKKKQEELEKWISEQHTCEHCGKIMTEKYGSGRFCSKICGCSHRHLSENSRKKISETLKAHFEKTTNKKEPPKCSICGKPLKKQPKTGLCQDCLRYTEEGRKIRSDISQKSQKNIISEGRHKGWQPRNIKSKSEEYFAQILDTNKIEYKREFPVKHINQNYLLDFFICKNNKLVDVEIDGKQHNYKDRIKLDKIRDEFLQQKGYIIYRIKWPYRNSVNSQRLIKNNIDNFISFYNNL